MTAENHNISSDTFLKAAAQRARYLEVLDMFPIFGCANDMQRLLTAATTTLNIRVRARLIETATGRVVWETVHGGSSVFGVPASLQETDVTRKHVFDLMSPDLAEIHARLMIELRCCPGGRGGFVTTLAQCAVRSLD